MTPDAVVFVVSQPYVGVGRLRRLAAGLAGACPLPSAFVRMEGTGPNLPTTLAAVRDQGYRRVLVQPVGLPFSASLANWLKGAVSHWRKHGGQDVDIVIGEDQSTDETVAAAIVERTLAAAPALPPLTARPALGKPGWNRPPPFRHHLLVCTGPRCHFHGAPGLARSLAHALDEHGLDNDVRVTQTGCQYPCNLGPLVIHYPPGNWYRLDGETAVTRFVKDALLGGQMLNDLCVLRETDPGYPRAPADADAATT